MRDTIYRQAAIDAIEEVTSSMSVCLTTDEYYGMTRMKGMAIGALIALPSAQPTQINTPNALESLDCISRQAAIDAIHYADTQIYDGEAAVGRRNYMTKEEACSIIDSLPSAQPEIVRCKDCKHWLPHEQFGYDEDNEEYHDYCAKLVPEDEYYAFRRQADEWCNRAERREE